LTKVVEIFTDGACRGNPGPGGWGVLLRYGKTDKELWGGEKNTTNNRMELWGAPPRRGMLNTPAEVVVYKL
jgi:ribonuclease HI